MGDVPLLRGRVLLGDGLTLSSTCKEKCPYRSGLWVCGKACEARPGDPDHYHFIGTSTSMHEWKTTVLDKLEQIEA
jgi:hypothetical protein